MTLTDAQLEARRSHYQDEQTTRPATVEELEEP